MITNTQPWKTLYPLAFRESCHAHRHVPFKFLCRASVFVFFVFSFDHENRDVLSLKISVTAFLHVQSP